MRFKEKVLATELREGGKTYSEILKSVHVSRSTLSMWLRDIELTPAQKAKILVGLEKSRYIAGRKKIADRILRTKLIVQQAKEETSKLIHMPLFLAGLALYWAEGAKNPEENVKLVNSDPVMIKLIMKWFREICRVPEEKFRCHVHMHNLHCKPDLEGYWSQITGIPKSRFYRSYVKESTLGLRKNILYNGTCSVVVNSKELFRKILGWKLGVQKYFRISP